MLQLVDGCGVGVGVVGAVGAAGVAGDGVVWSPPHAERRNRSRPRASRERETVMLIRT
jgi:hypothetical protein